MKDENKVLVLYYTLKNGHYDICSFFFQSSLNINEAGKNYSCIL